MSALMCFLIVEKFMTDLISKWVDHLWFFSLLGTLSFYNRQNSFRQSLCEAHSIENEAEQKC